MKSHEFITEVAQIDYVEHKKGKHKKSDPVNRDEVTMRPGAKFLGKMKSGHEIYSVPGRYSDMNYYAVEPNGLVDLWLGAHEEKNILSFLNIFAINPNNTLKAHDLYAWLITKLNKVLVANSETKYMNTGQSPGGHAVWKQLQKYHKDVNIHGWLNGKPVNVDMNDEEYTHAPRRSKYSDSPEAHEAERMELVASKK